MKLKLLFHNIKQNRWVHKTFRMLMDLNQKNSMNARCIEMKGHTLLCDHWSFHWMEQEFSEFSAFSEFGESDKSPKHELDSI